MTSIIPEALPGSLNLGTWKQVRNTRSGLQYVVLMRWLYTPFVGTIFVYTEERCQK